MKIKDKRAIQKILRRDDLPSIFAFLSSLPAVQTINPLFSGICHTDRAIRWHAIAAMGPCLARLANEEMEGARIVMRRFMWSLNDESGGIGWGAPEAMAEAMVHHARLAEEYAHILVAYMREDGYYLEYPPLQRGLMWALARLAGKRRRLLLERDAERYLSPYLRETDDEVRGLAAYALATLASRKACDLLAAAENLPRSVTVYSPEQDRHLEVDLGPYIESHCGQSEVVSEQT